MITNLSIVPNLSITTNLSILRLQKSLYSPQTNVQLADTLYAQRDELRHRELHYVDQRHGGEYDAGC